MKKTIILALILLGFIIVKAQQTVWESPYVGSSKDVLYLPDANAVYWRYGWNQNNKEQTGYVIKGFFPDVRYFSYNLYNDETKSTLGSIMDVSMEPDKDNPLKYTLYVIPEGTSIKAKNVLVIPKNVTSASIMLRHYLPNQNIYGNVAVPSIEKYNFKKEKTEQADKSTSVKKISIEDISKYVLPLLNKFLENPDEYREKIISNISKKSLSIEELICRQVVSNSFNYASADTILHSYNFKTEGTYPNNDNHYLVMPIIKKDSDICIVKFKAPVFPKTKNEREKADVRYFSVSQGDEITYNYITIPDQNLTINKEGYIYIMIASDNQKNRDLATKMNINFMPWLVNEKMLLVYRNMLPNKSFKNGVNSVPVFDKTKEEKSQRGDLFIGDYAPIGYFINSKNINNINRF